MKIPEITQQWLLNAEDDYIRYNAQKLLEPKAADRGMLLRDSFIQENIKLCKTWTQHVLRQHNKPDLLIHRLAMLADLGLQSTDPGMSQIIRQIYKHTNLQGIPEILMNIPTHFGGSGQAELTWMLCDFPTILYALLKMGVKDENTKKAVLTLRNLVDENGYRCRGSLSKFRGPGRKDDFCPYANLIVAKAFSEDRQAIKSPAAKRAVEALLVHWEKQKEKKYYLFGIGTNFRKLKFPLVWYDLLHMLEVISRYSAYHADKRFKQMIKELLAKTGKSMCFRPESIYMVYKQQEFSNKKEDSRIITLFVLRILKRIKYIS